MIKYVDMNAEISNEALEVITMAVDKYLATKNYEVITLCFEKWRGWGS
jgi:hypothetical protein